LGFEYGYALSRPEALVLWEAQFGDFANGAQVVIDNFLAAAEAKWLRSCGLVLMLPHGYEGQGPEHSSAHLERYLQLAAEENFEVVNASTPAQLFHLLRRQVRRGFRKPLILMSPKSLLRHPQAVSGLEELASGHFREVLEDAEDSRGAVEGRGPSGSGKPGKGTRSGAGAGARARSARRLILCSGKLYYELAARRAELGLNDTALVRVEQLYPFPKAALADVLGRYREVQRFIWAQEEPENRGALRYMRLALAENFQAVRFEFVSRPASASPAVGSHRLHEQEQERVLAQALGATPIAPKAQAAPIAQAAPGAPSAPEAPGASAAAAKPASSGDGKRAPSALHAASRPAAGQRPGRRVASAGKRKQAGGRK
jgi:2-oxoglutarate dehydrogenase complex dehydrogenase (E1) component-like enzyme